MKIDDKLMVIPTRRRYPILNERFRFDIKKNDKPKGFDYCDEYKFSIIWEFISRCKSSELEELTHIAKRMFNRDVYGDLMDIVIPLEISLYERDFDKALKLVNQLRIEISRV